MLVSNLVQRGQEGIQQAESRQPGHGSGLPRWFERRSESAAVMVRLDRVAMLRFPALDEN